MVTGMSHIDQNRRFRFVGVVMAPGWVSAAPVGR